MIDLLRGVCGGDGALALLAALLAALICIVTVPLVRRLAFRCGAVDLPGGRRVHTRPTARLGGVAVCAGVVSAATLAMVLGRGSMSGSWGKLPPILLSALMVCVVGARDDVRPLSPRAKLLGLAVAGALLTLGGVTIELVELPWFGRVELGALSALVTVLWVVACSNAMNLIDGVDGAGASVATVAAGVLALVAFAMGDVAAAALFAATCGSAFGFLCHNREPARIFLGDSGSLLLGFLLAATSAVGCTKRATGMLLVGAILTLAVPLLDSGQCFVRRFRGGWRDGATRCLRRAIRATAVADRSHIHHRLLQRGLSHRQVTRVLALVSLVTGLTTLLLLPTSWTMGNQLAVFGALGAAGWVLYRLARVPAQAPADGESVVVLRPPAERPVLIPGPPPAVPSATTASAERPVQPVEVMRR